MKELGQQWIEVIDGKMHMLKAVEGPKIVNGLMEGNTCHGCCYVDKWDDDCLNPNQACPVGKGVIIKDLGILNEDGCLPCPFCGEYPKIIHPTENMPVVSIVHTGVGHRILEFFSSEQKAIDAWNRRAR